MVNKIPRGKVATYRQVAKMLNTRDARKIGWALHVNSNPNVPCHRVVNKDGKVADSYAFEGWREQKRKLMEEGVCFIDEKHVDLKVYHWKKAI